jgi:replication initiation protein RepC
MHVDHHAAPVRGREPGGIRRATPALRRAERLAGDWRGLPEGVTRWRLAAALRAAAKPLGLTGTLLRLVELYVDLSYDQDWAADSEPVICRPLVEIAEQMDLSERQVRNLERRLVEIGLLAFRDSGNHARRGRRDRKSGKLVYAYGPSLAPMGARAAEIIALAEAARRAVSDGRRLRLAISALRRRIRADLVAAETAGIDARDLAEAFAAQPERIAAGLTPAALEARRDALEDLRAALTVRLGGVCPDALLPTLMPIITAGAEKNGFPYSDTSKPCTINGKSIPLKKVKSDGRSSVPEPRDGGEGRRRDHGLSAVPLGLAVAAAGPELRAALARQDGPLSWRALTEAARETAPLLGVGLELWGEACGRLGRGGAALAVAIIERGLARGPGEAAAPIRRPDAYLRGLLARAEAGELHLDRSLRAFAQRGAG